MLVTFHGTRGSLPVPGPRTLRYGGNTSCCSVRTRSGTLVILDMGTGAYPLGQHLAASGEPVRGHVLITHTHWDHIQGLPFFAPFFRPGNEWDIYAPRGVSSSLRETLSGQMQSTYFPLELHELGSTIRYHDLVEGHLSLDDVEVEAQYLHHPALTLGYRLTADGASLVYALDHEPFRAALAAGTGPIEDADRQHVAFLAGADLVIHDAQYTADEYPARIGWGHSSMDYAVRVAREAGVKRLVLAHHDPTRDDDELDELVRRHATEASRSGLIVLAAQEGQSLCVEGISGSSEAPSATPPATLSAGLPEALAGQLVVIVGADPARQQRLMALMRNDGIAALSCPFTTAPDVIRDQQPSLVLALGAADPAALRCCIEAAKDAAGSGHAIPVVLVGPPTSDDSALPGIADRLIEPFTDAYGRARIAAWLMRRACRWARPPVPADEPARLGALRSAGLLDRAADPRLTHLVELACSRFRVPIASVTLVDGDRQWFSASCGLSAPETPRDVSFCAHVVADPVALVVPDTLLDDRFADNPGVTGLPRLRFYAGQPLTDEAGHCLGTFCVADVRPRQFGTAELGDLARLAALAKELLSVTAPA